MGFNLKMFFETLLEMLDEEINDEAKIEELRKEILWQQEYAEECGQL